MSLERFSKQCMDNKIWTTRNKLTLVPHATLAGLGQDKSRLQKHTHEYSVEEIEEKQFDNSVANVEEH